MSAYEYQLHYTEVGPLLPFLPLWLKMAMIPLGIGGGMASLVYAFTDGGLSNPNGGAFIFLGYALFMAGVFFPIIL